MRLHIRVLSFAYGFICFFLLCSSFWVRGILWYLRMGLLMYTVIWSYLSREVWLPECVAWHILDFFGATILSTIIKMWVFRKCKHSVKFSRTKAKIVHSFNLCCNISFVSIKVSYMFCIIGYILFCFSELHISLLKTLCIWKYRVIPQFYFLSFSYKIQGWQAYVLITHIFYLKLSYHKEINHIKMCFLYSQVNHFDGFNTSSFWL